MSKGKYKALILGATGLIGSAVLRLLVNNDRYSHIYVITRAELPFDDAKIYAITATEEDVLSKLENISVDHFYCCIGTTKNKVDSNEEYIKIDHDYPIKVGQYLKNNGCTTISIVTCVGANIDSSNFYLKLKGQVEASIIGLNFQSTNIYRPSLLIGKRNESRPLERIAQSLSPLLDLLAFGNYDKYQSVKATDVAAAMLNISLLDKPGIHIYHTKEIKEKA